MSEPNTITPMSERLELGGESGISDVIDLALKQGETRVLTVGDPNTQHTMLAVPGGVRLVNVTDLLDARAPAPRRLIGTAHVTTLESFVELARRHKTEATAIFAEGGANPKLTAVIDYHANGEGKGSSPAWGEHRIVYCFPHAQGFLDWAQASNKQQKPFLEFLDEQRFVLVHPNDITKMEGESIVEPAIGDPVRDLVIEDYVAQDYDRAEAVKKKPATFYNTPKALITGVSKMTHKREETVTEATDTWGMIKVEVRRGTELVVSAELRQFFLARLTVYEGTKPRVLPVRLLVNTDQGLQFGVWIVGLKALREAAFAEACKAVAEATGCPIFAGKPESKTAQ